MLPGPIVLMICEHQSLEFSQRCMLRCTLALSRCIANWNYRSSAVTAWIRCPRSRKKARTPPLPYPLPKHIYYFVFYTISYDFQSWELCARYSHDYSFSFTIQRPFITWLGWPIRCLRGGMYRQNTKSTIAVGNYGDGSNAITIRLLFTTERTFGHTQKSASNVSLRVSVDGNPCDPYELE